MSNFLPTDYKIPTESKYLRWEANDNKFRIMSSPIIGWEYWTEIDKKRTPNRVRKFEEIPAIYQNLTGQERPKHFWAMVVWNYNEGKIQILEITQKSIMKALETLINDDDWGSPLNYDIVVKKEGDGLDTEYQTNPKPKKELDPEVIKAYKSITIELEALYRGDDPFSSDHNETVEDITDEDLSDAGLT